MAININIKNLLAIESCHRLHFFVFNIGAYKWNFSFDDARSTLSKPFSC